jgi:ribosomal-protein-alanine N-acetyltransferase
VARSRFNLAAVPPLPLPVRTRRLELRDFAAADLESMRAYASDSSVLEHVLYEARDGVQLREHLDRVLLAQRAHPRRAWELAVVVQRSGRVIGTCDLSLTGRSEADVGYMLARRYWGRGYATEAATALVDVAFRVLKVQRVRALVDVGNDRSRRVLEKSGLQWEALLRRHAHAKGRWWDCNLYSLDRRSWLRAGRGGEALAS